MQDKIEHGAKEKMKIRFDQVVKRNIRQQKVQAHPTLLHYFATRATATRSHYRPRGPAATKQNRVTNHQVLPRLCVQEEIDAQREALRAEEAREEEARRREQEASVH